MLNISPAESTLTVNSRVFGGDDGLNSTVVSFTVSDGGRTRTIRTWSKLTAANCARCAYTAAASRENRGVNDSWPVPGLGSSGFERNSEHVATLARTNRANRDRCGRRIAGNHRARLRERSVWEVSLALWRHPEAIARDCNELYQFWHCRFIANAKGPPSSGGP